MQRVAQFMLVSKRWIVLGIGDPDGVMLQIVNSLKDSLAPDIMPFVRVNSVELEEKQVIEIDVKQEQIGRTIFVKKA